MIDDLYHKDVSRISNGDIERWIKGSAEDHVKKLNDAFISFVADEIRAVVTWNQYASTLFPDYDVNVHAEIERELTGWDYLGMIVFSPLLLVIGIGFMLFGNEEAERRKLQDKINDAARQMNGFVEKAVAEFSKKLAFAG